MTFHVVPSARKASVTIRPGPRDWMSTEVTLPWSVCSALAS